MHTKYSEYSPNISNIGAYSYFFFEQKNDVVRLLPNGHAAYYPLVFHTKTKKVLEGELNFFNTNFYTHFDSPKLVEGLYTFLPYKQKHKNALVVNLLDNCFGHTALKLFSLLEIYKEYAQTNNIVVIVPIALAYLIPREKFHVITVRIGFYELEKCYDLAPITKEISKQYEKIDYLLLDLYEQQNRAEVNTFFNFTSSSKITKPNIPTVVFYYRSGSFRSWGGASKQHKNISALFTMLQSYFTGTSFYVLGDLDGYTFPDWIKDRRVKKFTQELDVFYNDIFARSVLTIGMFGSGILIPSILSSVTVHLIPRDKSKLMMENALNYTASSILSSYENCNLHGTENFKNWSAKRLGSFLVSHYKAYIEKCYKIQVSKQRNKETLIGQKTYTKQTHGYFNYEKALEYCQQTNTLINKKMFFQHKLYRLKKILGLEKS